MRVAVLEQCRDGYAVEHGGTLETLADIVSCPRSWAMPRWVQAAFDNELGAVPEAVLGVAESFAVK